MDYAGRINGSESRVLGVRGSNESQPFSLVPGYQPDRLSNLAGTRYPRRLKAEGSAEH